MGWFKRVFWVPLVAAGPLACGDDQPAQCEVATECVEECGGPVVQSGCDPCPSGSFDVLTCEGGGGGAGGGGGGGAPLGGGGAGGAGVCDIPECDTAINCLDMCGGMLVTISCCPCEGELVDATTCNGGGGGAGGGG